MSNPKSISASSLVDFHTERDHRVRPSKSAVWESKCYGAFVLNHRVVLHAIDATPARWRRCRFLVHPTHCLISTPNVTIESDHKYAHLLLAEHALPDSAEGLRARGPSRVARGRTDGRSLALSPRGPRWLVHRPRSRETQYTKNAQFRRFLEYWGGQVTTSAGFRSWLGRRESGRRQP